MHKLIKITSFRNFSPGRYNSSKSQTRIWIFFISKGQSSFCTLPCLEIDVFLPCLSRECVVSSFSLAGSTPSNLNLLKPSKSSSSLRSLVRWIRFVNCSVCTLSLFDRALIKIDSFAPTDLTFKNTTITSYP